MAGIFESFKSNSSILTKYVDYYYLDFNPDNSVNEFQCFPHFNNTISLYNSHVRLANGEIVFVVNGTPLQIFTPIRKKALTVKRLGEIHKIAIVFSPFGIQQFYRYLSFSNYITDYAFFTGEELKQLFKTTNMETLRQLLDGFLEKRFEPFHHPVIETAIQNIYQHYERFSVEELSSNIGVSRQHLNRLFQFHLGVSVKKFHEIVVFRKGINKKIIENSKDNFTRLAYEFSYSDQSHLNKIYRDFTGCSPKSFFNRGTRMGNEDTFWHLTT